MNINPDLPLVLLQLLPLFTVLAGLQMILFKPMLAYLAARKAATVGERASAEALKEKAALKLQQWDAALVRAHTEVAEFRAGRRAAAQAACAKQVAASRTLSDRYIADELAVLQGEAALARGEVGRMARSLAQDMAGRALGRALPAVEA
ncbi:MAG: hypothetical protein EXR71_00205 [Myxococcales bacterium]|nr:hypothetical protein [Myxococcales bacterium]